VTVFDRDIFYPIPTDVAHHILERRPHPTKSLPAEPLPTDLMQHQEGSRFIEATALKLGDLIDKQKPDVVLATQSWTSIITVLAKKYFSCPARIAATVDIHLSAMLPNDPNGKLFSYLIKKYFNTADRIITLCEGMKQDLTENFGTYPDKIEIIHNPVDTDQIRQSANESIEHPWFQDNFPILLFVGRLEPVKGIKHLLNAIAAEQESYQFRCVIVGDGAEKDILKNQAEELGIANKVSFLGRQSNPFKFMSRAKALVLPSLMEVLPYVLVEAMICGCPIIASDVPSGGIREMLEGGKCGILVPPGDEKCLSQAIIRMLQDGELRNRLIQAGYERARDFDSSQIVTQYMHTLETRNS
jgi:glycosyltransferase involved in cell wall biosynthesis